MPKDFNGNRVKLMVCDIIQSSKKFIKQNFKTTVDVLMGLEREYE
jgi:hypothetical protein